MRLYRTLKEQIMTGLVKPGDYLLPEYDLCKYYKMSRNSVRKALERLQNEGLVVKRPGLGTMVPAELSISPSDRNVLRILTPYPAHFVDNGLPAIIDTFSKAYPHVDVKVLSLPALNFWESFHSSFEMGLSPDVVMVSDLQLADRDVLAPFSDLTSVLDDRLDKIYPKLLNRFRHKDRLIGAPLTFTPVYLAYNPKLFASENIPLPSDNWTLDDFIGAAQGLTRVKNGMPFCYGFSVFPYVSRWPVFALQNGGAKKAGGLRENSLRKALTLLHDLLYRKRIATTYPDTDANPFLFDKAAMTLTTTFEMAGWKDKDLTFTPAVAPLPFGPTPSTLLQANALLIPSEAHSPELAREFVRMALDADVQRDMIRHSSFLSVIRDVNRDTCSRSYLHALNVEDALMNNNYFIHDLFNEAEIEELNSEFALFWLGLESAETVATACAKIR
jgi:multiple sugar transport system substrate-binding protein